MIEKVLSSFGITLNSGVFVTNADELAGHYVPMFPPTVDAVILDVNETEKVKAVLLANYPKEYHCKGLMQGKTSSLTLDELVDCESLEALYLPARKEASFAEDFQEVIAHLRAPEGCPWDRKQTHESLRSFILEEVYEFFDAVDENNPQEMAEELGDVMLQIYLHAQIGLEFDEFRLADVFTAISSKMRRRHPHVFADVDVNGSVGKVLTNWQEIKAQERKTNGNQKKKGALDGVSKGLPALLAAQHYQQRAILNGFHWDSEEGAFDKVREEVDEVLAAENNEELAEEYGDLLFSLVSAISYAGLEAEQVLREANQKFYQRFTKLEARLEDTGMRLVDMSECEKVQLWQSVK